MNAMSVRQRRFKDISIDLQKKIGEIGKIINH